MTAYSKTSNFTSKDTNQDIIAGADFDTEFDNLESAVNSKSDKIVSPTTNNVLSMDANGNLKDSAVGTTELALHREKSISLAGTDVTLSAAQQTGMIIVLTGTLTANVNVIFPTTNRMWRVVNNTSGSFTVTLKTSAQTGGVTVAQSTERNVRCDGTNIVVDPTDLQDGSVTTPKLADSSIITTKVADSSVTTAKLATDAVTNAKINKTLTYGSQTLADGATWTIPAGIYAASRVGAGLPLLQVYSGSTWVGDGSFTGGSFISDGTNVRIFNNDGTGNSITIHYRTLA